MKLKTKLSSGLGFLFVIIFTLIFFCMYYIDKISSDSENILKDNYNSVVYAKNMTSALNETYTVLLNGKVNQESDKLSKKTLEVFENAKNDFVKNLIFEKKNITETNEQKYADLLSMNFEKYVFISNIIKGATKTSETYRDLYDSYQNSQLYIDSISNVNMQAIIHKNQYAKHDAENKKIYMAILATICLMLAFFYFRYFPFYISNTISFLSEKIKDLLTKSGIENEIKTNDEAFVILEAINLLDKKLGKN